MWRLLLAMISLTLIGPSATLGSNAALGYLGNVQDRFHRSVMVYEDSGSAGNHFLAWARIPEEGAVTIDGSSAIMPHRGATAIKATFTNTHDSNWGGFYFLNGVLPEGATTPSANFGEIPGAGIDLTGATALTFWARGESGGEQVEFFVGGAGRNVSDGTPEHKDRDWYPDSFPRTSLDPVTLTLTTEWQQFRIPLEHRDLSYVLSGMGWVARDVCNPRGATFFLDDIEFELNPSAQQARLEEPRFLRSFETRPIQPDVHDLNQFDDIHLVLRNAASAYDNAVAGLAFLAEGSEESKRRARMIANAFVHATTNDRFFTDGRVRSFYAAGDIALPPGWMPNDQADTTPTPGFFDDRTQMFHEIEQGATDTGNNAWSMIFLLHAYRELGDIAYKNAATDIGNVIRSFHSNEAYKQGSVSIPGFLGGENLPESSSPMDRTWASTEHNIDVIVASRLAYDVTGDARWLEAARDASRFVEAMYDKDIGLYRAGTIDPTHINKLEHQLPADVNTWAILADPTTLQRHPDLLNNVLQRFVTTDHGFTGIDFNGHNVDGVQFEMTAHLVLALRMAGRNEKAQFFLNELNRAQSADPMNHLGAISSASRDGLTTGFDTADGKPFLYFDVKHIGATAWTALAQLGVNPYSLLAAEFVAGDFDGNGIVDAEDLARWKSGFGRSSGALSFEGNGNGDGDIDGSDFLAWQRQYGRVASVFAPASGVPEPTAALPTLSMVFTLCIVARNCPSTCLRFQKVGV